MRVKNEIILEHVNRVKNSEELNGEEKEDGEKKMEDMRPLTIYK